MTSETRRAGNPTLKLTADVLRISPPVNTGSSPGARHPHLRGVGYYVWAQREFEGKEYYEGGVLGHRTLIYWNTTGWVFYEHL